MFCRYTNSSSKHYSRCLQYSGKVFILCHSLICSGRSEPFRPEEQLLSIEGAILLTTRRRCICCHCTSHNNLEKVHYYLLRCTRLKCMLLQEFKDPSNYMYAVGSMVLMGHFFAKVRKCKDHILF